MKVIDMRRVVVLTTLGWLPLATTVAAEEQAFPSGEELPFESATRARAPRPVQAPRWNGSFVYGTTTFYDSDAHRTLGATFRIRLTSRLSVEPEIRYLSVPSYESSHGVWKHSDLLVAGHVVYDFRNEAEARIVPYVTGGAGWLQVRSKTTRYPTQVENRIPVFPTPSPAQSATTKSVSNWLWVGSAFGLRIVLRHGFFVSPELRVGGTLRDELGASAAIKMGYAF